MALLDAPDIDSVVSANRAIATQLLSAADLWLFVTTAARYADAVPWDLLRTAADRGTSVAIVLDRIPPDAVAEIRPHLAAMLREQGLPTAPIFTVPETTLDAEGRLPPEAVERLRSWLQALASDARARSIVVGQTLRGAVDSLSGRTAELVVASRDQHDAAVSLRKAVDESFAEAHRRVDDGMTDGTLLRGEVLARWQEFVGTGEFFRQIESTIARLARQGHGRRSRATRRPPTTSVRPCRAGSLRCCCPTPRPRPSETARAWRRLPGRQPSSRPTRTSPSRAPALRPRRRAARARLAGRGARPGAHRGPAAGAPTPASRPTGSTRSGCSSCSSRSAAPAGLTGAEVGIAGGTALLAQRVLEAIFGDQAVREMAAKARERLLKRARRALLRRARSALRRGAGRGVDRSPDQAHVWQPWQPRLRAVVR